MELGNIRLVENAVLEDTWFDSAIRSAAFPVAFRAVSGTGALTPTALIVRASAHRKNGQNS